MIRKRQLARDLVAERSERVEEPLRPCDACKRNDALRGGQVAVPGVYAEYRRMFHRLRDSHNGFFAAGHQDRIRQLRRIQRLAEMPGRYDAIVQVVDRHEQQIDVPLQLHVLKSVVQDADGGGEMPRREHTCKVTVGADKHGHTRKGASEQLRLVT
jgi:hypothetical protein